MMSESKASTVSKIRKVSGGVGVKGAEGSVQVTPSTVR